MFKTLLSAAVLAAIACTSAQAGPLTWIQTTSPPAAALVSAGSSTPTFTGMFFLTSQGFSPGVHRIDSFTLSIELADDLDLACQPSPSCAIEIGSVDLPGPAFDIQPFVLFSGNGVVTTIQRTFSIPFPYEFANTGTLLFDVRAVAGDFRFRSATLFATGDVIPPPSPPPTSPSVPPAPAGPIVSPTPTANGVPEPSTLSLLALAAAGLVASRRRSRARPAAQFSPR